MNDNVEARIAKTRSALLTSLCIALNVGLGKVSSLLALPFAMDTIGTVLSASLVAWPFVIIVGASSSALAAVVINPIFLYFIGTQIALAVTAILLMRGDMFGTVLKSLLSGVILGMVSGIVSAPVIATVFGGVTVPSISAVNAVLLASGRSLWESVLAGSLAVESVDKVAAALISYLILQRLRARA